MFRHSSTQVSPEESEAAGENTCWQDNPAEYREQG